MAVTFLANLCHFQFNLPAYQAGSHRKAAKINPLHDQIFPKSTVLYIGSPGIKCFYAVIGKKTDLPVPIPCMGIALNPKIPKKMSFVNPLFLHPPEQR